MSKMTILEIAQSILNAMDSDDINSIDDHEESVQVAGIIKDTYYELMSRDDWNHLKKPTQLLSLSDSDYPTTLEIPDNVVSMSEDSLRYDVRPTNADDPKYTTLHYKRPQYFLDSMLARASQDNVESYTVKGSAAPLYVFNDRHPSIWTSFDDKYITMDGYLSTVDSTVRGNKSIVYATVLPDFQLVDEFVPDMPAKMFPQFLAECKKACFFYLKEGMTPIDEKRALRGQHININSEGRAHDRRRKARYGRRSPRCW